VVDTKVRGSYPQDMEVHLSVEQEAELSRMADQTGKSADELAREAVDRYLTEEGRFRAGVQAGLDAAARGDFVPTSEVWARVERALKP
jgi:predicted transcriptional regulator